MPINLFSGSSDWIGAGNVTDWQLIEYERRLIKKFECLNDKPGLSDDEFAVAGREEEGRRLYRKYLQLGYPFARFPRLGEAFSAAGFYIGAAIKEILKASPLKIELQGLFFATRWGGPEEGFFLGGFGFDTGRKLSAVELKALEQYMIEEFQKRGVAFEEGDILITEWPEPSPFMYHLELTSKCERPVS